MNDNIDQLKKYQYDNRKVIFHAADDSDMFSVLLQSIPYKLNGKKYIYEAYTGTDHESFKSITDAYEYIFNYIDISIEKYFKNDDHKNENNFRGYCNLFYKSLITKDNLITKQLIEEADKYDLFFSKSDQYNKYLNKYNNIDNMFDCTCGHGYINNKDGLVYINNNEKMCPCKMELFNPCFLDEEIKLNKKDNNYHTNDVYIFNEDLYTLVEDEYKFTKIKL
jgi:hypothetical protein